MSTIHVVLRAAPLAMRELRGRERVQAQSALAREALARSALVSGARLGRLEKDAEDAPLPSNGWHWSVSHAGTVAAGVVARARVGVDVEPIEPRRSDLVARVTSRDELELLGGFSWDAFAHVWTAKEAVLKKAGCGLLELSRCRLVAIEGAERFVLHHRASDHVVHLVRVDGHVAALAHDGAADVAIAWSGDLVPAASGGDR